MRALLLAVAMLAAACSPEDDVANLGGGKVCTEEAAAGLNVRVADAADGRAICNAVVMAKDGAYAEKLEALGSGEDCQYAGAWERPGTYALEVSAPGYVAASVDKLVVQKGECHVVGVQETVSLRACTVTALPPPAGGDVNQRKSKNNRAARRMVFSPIRPFPHSILSGATSGGGGGAGLPGWGRPMTRLYGANG